MAHTLVRKDVGGGFTEMQCKVGDWSSPADFFDIDEWEAHLLGENTEWDE